MSRHFDPASFQSGVLERELRRETLLGAVFGSKGGGKSSGGGKSPEVSDDTLRSKNIARIIDIISEGETGGLYDSDNPLKSVFLDGTPVMNADGSLNFNGFSIEQRVGTPDQDPIAGFPAVESEVAVGLQVTTSSPVTVTVTDSDLDAVRVKVRIPRLSHIDSSGDIRLSSYQYAFDLQPDGESFQPVITPKKKDGKASNPWEIEHRIQLTGSSPWNIRMRRIWPDAPSDRTSNDTYFSSYTKVIDAKLKRPNLAYVAITADAEEFGERIASREYETKGVKVLVPANYDFDTRTYLTTGPGTSGGIWDGTFKSEISDSHAWNVYKLIVENRFGLGDYLGTLQPDKFAFYAMAQYSDELVSDGEGGTRPRFTCNTWIATRQQGIKLIQELLAGCWAQLVGVGGSIIPVQDRPTDATKLLAPANVLEPGFDYPGSALDERHSVAFVMFNDPENQYRPKPAAHEDPDLIARYGWRALNRDRKDCTSRAEAICHARWLLETENAGDYVSFASSFNAIKHRDTDDIVKDIAPGVVVKVADPAFAEVRYGGLIAAATTSQITIDAAVDLESGVGYTLSVVLPNLGVVDRAVTTAAGTTSVLDIAPALPDTPLAGAIWTLSSDDVEPRQFRILGIREREQHIFEFAGLRYDPDKYDRIFNNLTLPDRSFSAIPTGPIPPPTSVSAEEFLYESGASLLNAVIIGWTRANDPRVRTFEVEAAEPDTEEFYLIATTSAQTATMRDVAIGLWQFRVRAVDGLGRKSAYATTSLSVQGKTAKPADVTGFLVTVQGTVAQAKWDLHPDLDVRVGGNIVLRFTPLTGANATWDNAQELPPFAGNTTTGMVSILVGTYLAKARDSSGNYSTNAVKTEVGSTGALNFNAVATQIEDPTFSGVKQDVVVSDALLPGDALLFDTIPDFDAVADLDAYSTQNAGVLQLAGAGLFDDIPDFDAVTDLDSFGGLASEGTYFFSDHVDAGQVYESVRITATLEALGVAVGLTIDNRPGTIDTWENIDGTVAGATSATLYISITDDDPGGTPTWSEYALFIPGDYRGRAFRFKLVLATTLPDQNILVSTLRVTVDMPDRFETFTGLLTINGPLRVEFAAPFFIKPANAVTPIAMLETEKLQITNEDEFGLDVEVLTSLGANVVGRAFNVVSKGAGVRVV
jgi:predicted phage tail protein